MVALEGVLPLYLALAGAPIALAWTAPEGCPSEQVVLEGIEADLGPIDSPVRLTATATITGPPWTAILTVEGSTRALAAKSCPALARAIGLILVVSYESLLASASTPIEVAEAPGPRPALPAVEARPSLPASDGPTLRLAAAGELGALDAPTIGVDLELGWAIPPLHVSAGVAVFLPRARILRPDPEAGGHLHRVTAIVRGCYQVGQEDLALGLCGLGEAGILWGTSFGVTRPGSAAAPWIALGIELAPEWRLSPDWSLVVPLTLVIPAIRPIFRLDPLGDIGQPGLASFRAGLGLERRFL